MERMHFIKTLSFLAFNDTERPFQICCGAFEHKAGALWKRHATFQRTYVCNFSGFFEAVVRMLFPGDGL
jgi:hypothetical protein